MAAKKTVELFYDVLSPYSWIAFESLLRYRAAWNIDLKLQPFLLAGVMKETGNTPPGMHPLKATYMVKDLGRLFGFYGLGQIKFPSDPINVLMVKGSLSTMRLLTAVKMSKSDKLEEMSREFWKRVYNTDDDVTSPESLLEVCKKVNLREDESEKLLEQSKTEAVNAKFKETTQRAIEHGSFGAPTILVDNAQGGKEMFFGSDRFPLIARLLGIDSHEPLNPDQMSKL